MFLVIVLLAGAGGGVWLMDRIASVDRIPDVDVAPVAEGEPSNYLVVGSDVRPDSGEFGEVGGARSDTIMIVRIDPRTREAWLLSLPRDVLVPIAGHESEGPRKLNEAYSIGHQTLVDTISLNFHIQINHYVVVDFEGFRRLVDAVGGIDLFFDRAARDRESGFFLDELGCVTLNGDQALAYARSRHFQYLQENGRWSSEDPLADLGRIQRQQMFIRAAVTEALQQVSDPFRARELIDIGLDSVSIDQQTDPLDLVEQFSDFDLDNLQTFSLPVVDVVVGRSITVDQLRAPSVLAVFQGGDPGDIPAGAITVDVLNGTGVEMQANDVAAAFQQVGFQLGERGDFEPQPVATTTVRHAPGEEAVGLRVARHITGGAIVEVGEDVPSGHVTVVTGQDFTTVHRQPTPVDEMPTPAGASTTTTTTAPDTTTTTAPPVTTTTQPPSEYTLGAPC